MNKAQRRYIFNLIMILPVLIIVYIFREWIYNHEASLRWIVLVVFSIIALLSKSKGEFVIGTREERRSALNSVINENLWMKIYYFVFSLSLAIGIPFAVYQSDDVLDTFGSVWILSLFGLFFLPIIIHGIISGYEDAGEKS
jgi:hypothetical protein